MAFINTGYKGIPLREIIKQLGNKDYNFIEIRCKWKEKNEEFDEFIGACSYKKGELMPLDGDTYSLDDLYVEYKEWVDLEENEVDGGKLILTVWELGEILPF